MRWFKIAKSWLVKDEEYNGYVFSMSLVQTEIDITTYEIFNRELKNALVDRLFTEIKPFLLKDEKLSTELINEIRLLVAKKFIKEK